MHYDPCVEVEAGVETASFWAMVDSEIRRNKDDRQDRSILVFRDQCIGVEAEDEESIDCTAKPVDDLYTSRISGTSAISAEGHGRALLRALDAGGTDDDESMSGTRRARNTRPRRPRTVMRVSKTEKKSKRRRRKFGTAQVTIPAARIPLGLGTNDARLVSAPVLLFLLLFSFFHLFCGRQNPLLYVAYFILSMFFDLYCVQVVWQK